jgi:hypothetical protein
MNESDPDIDRRPELACFRISLVIFIATVTCLVAEILRLRRSPAGDDAGFAATGEIITLIPVAATGVFSAMIFSFVAMFKLRRGFVLFFVQLLAVACIACVLL